MNIWMNELITLLHLKQLILWSSVDLEYKIKSSHFMPCFRWIESLLICSYNLKRTAISYSKEIPVYWFVFVSCEYVTT